VLLNVATEAHAQEDRTPTPPTSPRQNGAPPSTQPPTGQVTVEELAERLRAMEETNRKLAEELKATRREHNEQMRQLMGLLERSGIPRQVSFDRKQDESPGRGAAAGGLPTRNAGPADDVETPVPDYTEGLFPPFEFAPRFAPPSAPRTEDSGTPAYVETPVPDYTEGQFAPFAPPPGYPLPSAPPQRSRRLPLGGTFGPGFQWQTDDEKFRLQIRYESQIEGRVWAQSDQIPANSGIFLPRQRIFFNGNITRNIEYEFAINRGFGNLNLLNAFVNLHFDDRFEVRMGRFFTPFNYDQYAISNYWLPTPERSIYTTNVGLNRQFGVMGWGYLFDKRLDYAAGIFNGSRNSFEPLSHGVDFVTYLNARPFQESDALPFLRFLNLGTSFAFGHQNQAPVPVSFRIAGGSPTADVPGPGTVPFLILNPNVIERGNRLLGSVHAAYFLKGLSLIGEWQYGYGSYALAGQPTSAQVPFSGFYVTAGYFLTGEEVERRTRVQPLRPLIPTNRDDRRGIGAWEAVAGVSRLSLGQEVFRGGFADPDLWSNSATTTELGLNWYWNEYIKIYAFWLHGDFAEPVLYRPGRFQSTSDMFWLRFQLYF
jgi:phosphate-selective porin OprO/OprP